MTQRDSVGLETERDAFAGWLSAANEHSFMSARWDGALGQWIASAAFGDDRYTRRTAVGVLDLDVEDETQSWRVDAARAGGTHVDWRLGANGTFTQATLAGHVPVAGGDLGGISGVSPFDVDFRDWYAGTYLEATTTLGIVSTTAGARIDRFGLAQATTVDPRVNVRVALGRRRAMRYATGIYHQAPAASYYDSVRGAARLAPMRAVHHVVGYETGREAEGLYLRVEGYVKRYRDLPLEEALDGRYSSTGHGWSKGVDLFVQRRSSRLETLARRLIRKYTTGCAGVEIVCECADTTTLALALVDVPAEAALVDVRMPGRICSMCSRTWVSSTRCRPLSLRRPTIAMRCVRLI